MKHRGLVHVRSRSADPEFPGRGTGTVFQIFLPDNPGPGNGNGAGAEGVQISPEAVS
jgi:hypothetical protein